MADFTDPTFIALMLIGSVSVGAIVFLLCYPFLSGEAATEKRIQGIAEGKATRSARRVKEDETQNRRKQVADTLKELEERQKAKEKVTLRIRLQRAGLDITPKAFWISSVVSGVVVAVFVFVSSPGMTPLVPAAAGFVGMLLRSLWVARIHWQRGYSVLERPESTMEDR